MFACVLLCTLLGFCFTFCLSKIQSKFLALTIFDFRGYFALGGTIYHPNFKSLSEAVSVGFSKCFDHSLIIHTTLLSFTCVLADITDKTPDT